MPKRAILYTGVLGLVVMLMVKSCDGPQDVDIAELPAATDLHVAIKNRVVTVKTHTGTMSDYVPDRGRADVIVDNEGVIDLHVKSAGLSLQPVFGGFVATHAHIAIGAQVVYWNRAELYVGGAYPLCAWAGIGYRLDQIFLPNTSVLAIYTTRKEPGLGILVRF